MMTETQQDPTQEPAQDAPADAGDAQAQEPVEISPDPGEPAPNDNPDPPRETFGREISPNPGEAS